VNVPEEVKMMEEAVARVAGSSATHKKSGTRISLVDEREKARCGIFGRLSGATKKIGLHTVRALAVIFARTFATNCENQSNKIQRPAYILCYGD
jgi:hypothetical protein